MDNPYASYRRTQIETATPGQLVVMLYEGAVRFLAVAETALGKGDWSTAHGALLRAQDIIGELRATLNPEGGEIALKLDALYDYMLRRLIEANVRKDPVPVKEVMGYLQEMIPAWQEASKAQYAAETKVAAGVITG